MSQRLPLRPFLPLCPFLKFSLLVGCWQRQRACALCLAFADTWPLPLLAAFVLALPMAGVLPHVPLLVRFYLGHTVISRHHPLSTSNHPACAHTSGRTWMVLNTTHFLCFGLWETPAWLGVAVHLHPAFAWHIQIYLMTFAGLHIGWTTFIILQTRVCLTILPFRHSFILSLLF